MSEYNYRGPGSAAELDMAARTTFRRAWPITDEERQKEIHRRWEAYTGAPYSDEDVKRMSLFQYRDDENRVAITARRLSADLAFVTEVDAAAIATAGVALQLEPDMADQLKVLDAGMLVWRSSRIDERIHEWALSECMRGEGLLEATRHPRTGLPVVIWHEAQHFRVEWDDLHMEPERVTITYDLCKPAKVSAKGEPVGAPETYRYVRVLTPTEVTVYSDGVIVPGESGPNPLGVVPCARVAFRDVGRGLLSAWAGTHYEDAVATLDSLITQMQALGTRHANPILKAMGISLGADADLQTAGRMVELPRDTDLQWLEANLQAIQALVQQAEQLQTSMRQTLPEFLFTESANSSGLALSYRASAFVAKIRPIRERFYRALARVLGFAVAIGAGGAWTDDRDVYRVDGGDPLPLDEGARVALIRELVTDGMLRRVDGIRQLQGIGVVPDGDPEAYAAAALGEMQALAGQEAGRIGELLALIESLKAVADGRELQVEEEPEEEQTDNLSIEGDEPGQDDMADDQGGQDDAGPPQA